MFYGVGEPGCTSAGEGRWSPQAASSLRASVFTIQPPLPSSISPSIVDLPLASAGGSYVTSRISVPTGEISVTFRTLGFEFIYSLALRLEISEENVPIF